MKAQEWWDRGHERKDPFDAFGDYWRAFNNLYAGQRGHETQKIRSYLAEQVSEDQAQSVLNAHGKGIACLLDRPINDMRGNGRHTAANIAAFHRSANENVKLQELFVIIYQIRCNYEHGQKAPSNETDVEFCRAAGPIVSDICGLEFAKPAQATV